MDCDPDILGHSRIRWDTRVPAQLQQYKRIAEIIDADEERRRQGRERFKVYRDLKIPLETHQIDPAADV